MKRVIGAGGATIKALEASTRAKVVVAEGGLVHMYAPSAERFEGVRAQVQAMTGADIQACCGFFSLSPSLRVWDGPAASRTVGP